MKSILIFGGAGFVGNHIVARLSKKGYKIVIPYQKSVNEAKLRLFGTVGQIIPLYYKSLDDQRIRSLIINSNVIINLKTSWDNKYSSFDQSIYEFNAKLISIIGKSKNLDQFIYFSGLGVDNNKYSRRSQSIIKTEKLITESINNSIIVRPGVIIGGGDKFLSVLLKIIKISFFIPLFGNGLSKFQPVFIDDISKVIEYMISKNLSGKHLFELTGPNTITYKEFYKKIADFIGKKRIFIPLPMFIVKFIIRILDKTPFSPINLEQLNLFENENIKKNIDKDFNYCLIVPQDTLEILKKHCRK